METHCHTNSELLLECFRGFVATILVRVGIYPLTLFSTGLLWRSFRAPSLQSNTQVNDYSEDAIQHIKALVPFIDSFCVTITHNDAPISTHTLCLDDLSLNTDPDEFVDSLT